MSNHLRLFLAIPLPLKIQKQLVRKFQSLHLKHVHRHPTQQLHITIHFYGLVEEDCLPSLIRQIEETLMGVENFSLLINHVGYFPKTKRPRILWYGLSGDIAKLTALVSRFQITEDKPFDAHITIAMIDRYAKLSARTEAKEQFMQLTFRKLLFFAANEVILYRSQLTRSNPVYTKIATFSLQ